MKWLLERLFYYMVVKTSSPECRINEIVFSLNEIWFCMQTSTVHRQERRVTIWGDPALNYIPKLLQLQVLAWFPNDPPFQPLWAAWRIIQRGTCKTSKNNRIILIPQGGGASQNFTQWLYGTDNLCTLIWISTDNDWWAAATAYNGAHLCRRTGFGGSKTFRMDEMCGGWSDLYTRNVFVSHICVWTLSRYKPRTKNHSAQKCQRADLEHFLP